MKTNLLKSIFISLILVMGVCNAWAIGFNKGNVIFRAQGWNNPTYVYLCVGHSSYTQVWRMTRISNTDLYHVWVNVDNNDNNWWNGCTYFAVIGSTSQVTSGNWGNSSLSTKGKTAYTAAYTAAYDVNNSSGVYFFNKNNSTVKGGNFTIDYKNSYSNIPTLVATQSAKVRNTTSDSYSTHSGSWPASLKLQGTKLTGDNTSTTETKTSTTSTDSYRTHNTVVTGSVTHSYANISEDYQFDGWIQGTGANLSSTANTYSYKITEATTVYACFTKKYAVNFGVHSSGGGTISAKSGSTTLQTGNKIVGGSQVVFTASPSNGYQVEGWYSDANCTSKIEAAGTNTTYTLTALESTAYVYVKFKGVQYTVTLNQEDATTTGTTSVTATYGVTMPTIANLPTRNGYTFKGYYDAQSGGTKYYNADGSSAKDWDKTAATPLYAQWTAKDITINWNANGGSVTPTSSTYTYDGNAITLPTPSYTGHRFLGWYTAADGGTQITDVGTTNKPYTTVTYYAHWEVSIIEHTVTFAVGTGSTEYGTLTAATNSGNITSGSNIVEGTSVTFTATPKPGYEVEYWYTNAACTEGEHDAGSTTYTTTVNDALNVYVKFVEKKWSVAFAAGTGGAVSPKETQTVGEANGVIIIATTNKGYTFAGWESSNGGKFDDAKAEKTTFYPTEATTVTASFTENLYAISVKSSNENFGIVSQESESAGIDTKVTITATPKLGYEFVNWTATNGITIADANSPTTTITATAEGTVTANFSITNYTITYHLNGGTNNTSNPTSYTVETETITLQDPTKEGFLFAGWYTNSTFSGTAVTSITKGSTGDKNLYAKWLDSRDCIFFYNNLGWSNVYVYFYSSDKYWDDSKGTGSKKEQTFSQEGDAEHKPHYLEYRGKMTKIEGTNIWYYNRSIHSEINRDNYTTVAFTKDQQYNYEFFYDTEVVRRGDFNSNVPMFVSMKENKVTKNNNKTSYYNTGYWMNYPTNTGYKLHIFDQDGNKINDQLVDIPFEYSDNTIMPWSVNVSLEGAKTYAFKIQRADGTNDGNGTWYGNNGTMTTNSSGDVGQTAWEFTTGTDNCKITTTAPGTYVFTLKYGKDINNNYNYLVGVEYPASVGDYRLAYKDNTHLFHPGHLLKKRDGKETVSFFVHHNLSPEIMLQQVTKIDAQTGDITWTTIKTTNNLNGITATGIYNFILEQSGDKATLLNTATKYDGDFYIRTNAAAGGWGNFRQNGNKMTYTSYADNQEGFNFNHYFVKWINAGTNVKFTIANDYSYCLSDTLDADDIVTTGNLPANANVRFGWNSKTNKLTRAYIAGSSTASDRYLVLTGDNKLTDLKGEQFNISGLDENEAIFADMGNWIYQLDAKAGRGASIQLTARYNKTDQTFFNTSAVALAEEGNETTYPVRFIYDFKTNNLMAAWLLEKDKNDIQGGNDLNANMLLLRRHHNQAQQIQLTNKLSKVGTAYGVMTFEEDFVNDTQKSIYERALYWVSFPFDVRIRDVFGFGEYMDTWIMEYYDGEARATNGAWVDSESYWTYITDLDYVLTAGVGYVLCLDLDKMGADSKVFENTDEVSLYFPSATPIGDIDVEQAVSITVTGHQCEINRPTPQGDRRIADSNWNVIGVPRFINLNITLNGGTIDQQDVVYYYQYNASNNTYQAAVNSGEQTFQTMQAYMVQYAGEINWWEMADWTPQQLAARRNANATPEKVNIRLEIAQDDVTADKTFIQLQEEGATADFDMNKDLTKIINAGTNIYTIISQGSVLTAGNVMPMSECVVPVGVKVDAEGEYTFRMPDGTEGMVVELIDYYTNTRTNLLLFDYTVDLSAGTCNDRFALHIQPSKSGVTTGIEGAYPQTLPEGKGTKFLIDGKLIIRTAEGVVYDAQGHRL